MAFMFAVTMYHLRLHKIQHKAKYLLLLAICYPLIISYGVYQHFEKNEQLSHRLQSGEVETMSGTLHNWFWGQKRGYTEPKWGLSSVEELEIGDSVLVRLNPRIESGGVGCFDGSLKGLLSNKIGKTIEITYVFKHSNTETDYPIPCILKVEELES
jgi:hypothetical protein